MYVLFFIETQYYLHTRICMYIYSPIDYLTVKYGLFVVCVYCRCMKEINHHIVINKILCTRTNSYVCMCVCMDACVCMCFYLGTLKCHLCMQKLLRIIHMYKLLHKRLLYFIQMQSKIAVYGGI